MAASTTRARRPNQADLSTGGTSMRVCARRLKERADPTSTFSDMGAASAPTVVSAIGGAPDRTRTHPHIRQAAGPPRRPGCGLLRDHLRSDPDDRRLSERTKQALMAQRWADMNDDADAKSDVIRTIKARARAAHPDSDRVETVR